MSEQMREIGRTAKAADRILWWVAEAEPDAAAALASSTPARDLDVARRQLAHSAAALVRVDRERAVEEADIALREADLAHGAASLIANLVQAALRRALDGADGPPPASAALARGAGLRAVA